MHVCADDACEAALAHVLHHDLRVRRAGRLHPEFVLPVEAVAYPHDVAVVRGLLESQLVPDIY